MPIASLGLPTHLPFAATSPRVAACVSACSPPLDRRNALHHAEAATTAPVPTLRQCRWGRCLFSSNGWKPPPRRRRSCRTTRGCYGVATSSVVGSRCRSSLPRHGMRQRRRSTPLVRTTCWSCSCSRAAAYSSTRFVHPTRVANRAHLPHLPSPPCALPASTLTNALAARPPTPTHTQPQPSPDGGAKTSQVELPALLRG